MFYPNGPSCKAIPGDVAKMAQFGAGSRRRAVGAAALAVTLLIGCTPAPQQAKSGYAPSDGPTSGGTGPMPGPPPTTEARKAAPDFSLPTQGGKTVKLSDSAGKVRLVAFWSVTCIPCIKEMPALRALYGKYRGRGFEILYLSADAPSIQKPFLAKRGGVPFPALVADDATLKAYDVTALPKMALVDREGQIVKEYLGETDAALLEKGVKAALAG
jgi:peroxiredoxin